MTPPEMQRKAIFAHLETIMETCDPKVARAALAECGLVPRTDLEGIPTSAAWLNTSGTAASKQWRAGWDACRSHLIDGAFGVKVPQVPQVRLIGTACSSDPCEREQQCRSAGTCDPWRGRFPKDGDWPCEECGKPEKEHVGAGQQCPSGAKRFFPADPNGVAACEAQNKGGKQP